MGYIDGKLGIKTNEDLAKYLSDRFERDIMVVMIDNSLKIIWAVDDKLHTYDVQHRVVYVIMEDALNIAILTIRDSLTNKKHQHIMNCVEYELIEAKDGDEIRIVIQENKAEIWKGNIYTGRHLFK